MDMDDIKIPCTSTNVIVKKNGMCFDIKFSSTSVNPFKKLITPKEFNLSDQKQNSDSAKLSQTIPYKEHIGSPYLSENETQKTDKWTNTSKGITFSAQIPDQKMRSIIKKKPTLEQIRQKLFEAAQRRLCQNRYKNCNVLLKVSKVKQNRLKLFTSYRELVKMRLSSRMKQCDDRRTKKILSIQRKAQNESIKLKDAAHKVNITRQKILRDCFSKLKQMENVTKLKDPPYQDSQVLATNQLKVDDIENKNKKTVIAEEVNFEEVRNEQGLLEEVVSEHLCPTDSKVQNELLEEVVSQSLCSVEEEVKGDEKLLIKVVNGQLCPTNNKSDKDNGEKEILGEIGNERLCPAPCHSHKNDGDNETEEDNKCNKDCKNEIEVIENAVQKHAERIELEFIDTSEYNVPNLSSEELRNEVKSTFEKVTLRYEQCKEMLQRMNEVMKPLRQDMEIKPALIATNAQCNKQSKDVKLPKQQKATKKLTPQVKKDGISGKRLVVMKDRPCCSTLEQNEGVKDVSKPKPKTKLHMSQKPKIPWRY
ncbi:uncharacterized protein LOC119686025 isoform X2 [Teleopsis dalmanni]|uniref:uncharacterized protein LOC119686025 isoform X2 n=1 Tax=Teleopsis dalmanni TaxID=139649 RepID=UPI0018CFB4C6|nr:uncharacterized protein LOC119686025 isoform X2 [Teleopsis dalmanni]